MTGRTRVRVDFHSRGTDGAVRASMRRADGPLAVGAVVEAYDPAEPHMSFDATVTELDEESGRALLDVHWEPRPVMTSRAGREVVPIIAQDDSQPIDWAAEAAVWGDETLEWAEASFEAAAETWPAE